MSERPSLYCRRVAPGELAAALKVFESSLRYLYFESETTIDLLAYRPPDPAWTHGRAFGAEMEVRWQRVGASFDLLLMTERELPLPDGWVGLEDASQLPCPDSADPPGQILLWGTHISHLDTSHYLASKGGNAWIETRIPRSLHYPLDGTPRWVKANVIVYRCQGRPVLTRMVGLEGEEYDEQQALH